MPHITLLDVAVVLAAMAIAAPLARWLGIGTVLGYLLAGMAIGPPGFRLAFGTSHEAEAILHLAEFGVVFLLFLIGLELRPKRLWAMRSAILGFGSSQVLVSALLLTSIGFVLGLPLLPSLFIGLALALSSTAFALQILEENGELQARHGRLGFATLLFQDLAAIPLIALAPMFAVAAANEATSMDPMAALKAVAVIAAVIVVGHLLVGRALELIARTKVKEAMTAAALVTVVGAAVVMQSAGLSASLGAFIAGALLAESSYRHQLEADIQPFEGLLLGLFFTAIGMSLNLGLLIERPAFILALAVALVAIKTLVLYALARLQGLPSGPSARLGLSLSQGGEFAFVLFTAGLGAGVMGRETSELLIVVVTLSMAMTPLLLMAQSALWPPAGTVEQRADDMPDAEQHVIIAGFGRYGQITARILRAKNIPFTALDISAEQIAFVERFGSKAFFGDASRPEILEAAQTGKANAFVLAIDDPEASVRTAGIVRSNYPGLPIYARARNRNHAHRLLDLGVENIHRETLHSALLTTQDVLEGLGQPSDRARRTIALFKEHDHRRLMDDYKDFTDMEKLQAKARNNAETLSALFAEDEREEAAVAKARGTGSAQ